MRNFLSIMLVLCLISTASFGQAFQETSNPKGTNVISKRTVPFEVNRSMNVALSENFDGSATIPTGWETSTNNPWLIQDDGSGSNNRAIFDMWNYASSAEGTITTVPMSVTAGDATLTFSLEYYLISGSYGDTGEMYVAVSNDNGATWTESSTNAIAGTAGAAASTYTLDFTSFEGNDYTGDVVKVRLRGVSDYGSYNIALDNFVGPQIPAINDDIAMVSINTVAATTPANIDITGTIRNMGNQADLTSFDVVYTIDGGATSAVYNVTGQTVAPGTTFDFTHNVPYNAPVGAHTIEVTISNPNGNVDENPGDNVMSKGLMIINEIFPKAVVYEEGTGTWCGFCVRGLVGLNTMAHNITDGTWIGIGVHNGDPMTVAEHDNAVSAFISGYPSGIMDRHPVDIDPGLTELESYYNVRKLEVPVAKPVIDNGTWNSTTREMSIDIESFFALDIASANYNAAIIVIEDGVTGTASGYDQSNYYDNGGYGAMEDWDGFNYVGAGNPVPAANMTYNHVSRALLGGWSGEAGSIPSSVVYGTGYVHTYTHTLPADQDYNNINLVGIVIDNANGHIINATEVHAKDVLTTLGIDKVNNSNFNIFPNPTTGLVKIESVEGAQVVVYNMIGEVVYNEANASATTTIDLSTSSAGNYIIKVINNNEVSTQKIVLTK